MYFVNEQQINVRLAAITRLSETAAELKQAWIGNQLQALAQERILHLAIEIVTDIGSYLIDGFIMRDASSYEDIIEITSGEGVYPEHLKPFLLSLVRLRKALVQDYYEWQHDELHPLLIQLPEAMHQYSDAIKQYLQRELEK